MGGDRGGREDRGVRFFCLAVRREVVASSDYLGRVVCPACGERVLPVVERRSA